jgi:hypothetical protein
MVPGGDWSETGLLQSGFLFLLVIDWVMQKTTKYERCDFTTFLGDLDIADDLTFLSSTMKTTAENINS